MRLHLHRGAHARDLPIQPTKHRTESVRVDEFVLGQSPETGNDVERARAGFVRLDDWQSVEIDFRLAIDSAQHASANCARAETILVRLHLDRRS